MTEREKLIELLRKPTYIMDGDIVIGEHKMSYHKAESLADHLFANGVIVLPVKVGNEVYTIHKGDYRHNWKPYVNESRVVEINHECDRSGRDIGWGLVLYNLENYAATRYKMSNIGKTVFLTREEAEAALKERENNGAD